MVRFLRFHGNWRLRAVWHAVRWRGLSPTAVSRRALYEATVIHRRGPWRSFEAVEQATLERVDGFNSRRLLGSIGSIRPAEAKANYDAALEAPDRAA